VVHLTSAQWFFLHITIWHILVLLIVTPFIHITANVLFRKIKKKQGKNLRV
jgi:hypothetical protein